MNQFLKNTLTTFLNYIILFILDTGISVIIARVLGPEKKGEYSLVILLPTLLIIFIGLGIGQASIFFASKKKYRLNEIFGINIIFSALTSLAAVIIGFFLIKYFAGQLFPQVGKNYLFLALLLVPVQLFFTFGNNLFLGLKKVTTYNLFLTFQLFLFFLFILSLFFGKYLDIKTIIITEILSFLITYIFLFIKMNKATNGISLITQKTVFKDFLNYGSKIYLVNIISFLHLRIDIFIINLFLNPMAVGLYSVAVGLAEKIWVFSQSASIVLFPRISAERNEKKLKEFTPIVCRNILFLSFLISLVLIVFSRWIIILLYSEKFAAATPALCVLLIGTTAVSASRILSNDLAGRNRFRENIYINIFSVIVNIILNILMIPKFGILGSAIATAISYLLMLILRVFVYAKISKNRISDVVLIKISDFKYYRNFFIFLKNKIFST